jgi:restriction system protein
MSKSDLKVRTPLFPRFSEIRALIRVIEGVPKSQCTHLIQSIWNQTGTPQNPVDWSEPDTWIKERLDGEDESLANRIWIETNKELNPRHIYGAYLFINTYELLVPDEQGIYRLTDRCRGFLENKPEIIHELDDAEGLMQLLLILSIKPKAKRADILPEWSKFLKEYSKYGTPTTIQDTLRRRLLILLERELISRTGIYYSITKEGQEYLSKYSKSEFDKKRNVLESIGQYNDTQKELLKEKLKVMSPYQFEHLIRQLLEVMGYEDVVVTKQSGDKGVDVVATVQFGITTITEVVQVKRHQGSIGRPVLDQLRGALPYHNAIRGTLITLGSFSRGCRDVALYAGAAPISLIDGDKLLELLFEHEIGVQPRQVSLFEVDETYFETSDEPKDLEG